jgi:adenylate kinase
LKKVIGITGTPATGKRSVGKELAKILNFSLIHINEAAREANAIDDSGEVSIRKLRKRLKEILKDKKAVVIGHLLPYVLKRSEVDLVIVLRCHPNELERRLIQRGYSNKKVKENVASEILDLILYDCIKKFGKEKVCEIDTTYLTPTSVAKQIFEILQGKREKKIGIADWLSLAEKDKELLRFLH